jgi:Ca-activated chloride channel family protein
MRRILVPALLGLVLSLPVEHTAVGYGTGPALQQKRTVYVSVTQNDGAPVTDLTAADFVVKEGGKPVQVVGAELTKTPIRLTMIVADGGSGGFQIALVTLVQRLQEVAEFSLVSVINQPEKIVDFTTDLDKVVEGLKRLGARGTTKAAGQVIEAVADAVKQPPDASKRPVVIVMTVGGSAATDVRATDVREALRRTGTLLYAMSPTGNAGGAGQIDIVLNDGSRDTGGRHEQFSSQTLTKIAEQIGQELLNQYQVSYAPPDGGKPGDRLEVSTRRKNIKVNAPTRVADYS